MFSGGLRRAATMPASSKRPQTVAAIFAAVWSSRSRSSENERTILSLQRTDPPSVSESVRLIRTWSAIFLTCPSSTYRTERASPTLMGSSCVSGRAKVALRDATKIRLNRASSTMSFCQAFCQKALVVVATHNAEGEDGNGRGALHPYGLLPSSRRLEEAMVPDFGADSVDADWLRDVFKDPFAQALEGVGRIALHIVEEDPAHANRIGLGILLYARGDIYAIANEVITSDHHIGEVKSEPHFGGFTVPPIVSS
jgi:hypothetical protein